MSISQLNTIDIISTSPDGRIVLTISDHYSWDEADHLLHLQNKINSYLQFIESGQIFEDYPNASEKMLMIEVVMKYIPTEEVISFLEKVRDVIVNAGYEFRWRTLSLDK